MSLCDQLVYPYGKLSSLCGHFQSFCGHFVFVSGYSESLYDCFASVYGHF